MRRWCSILCCCLLCLSSLLPTAIAQETTATVTGTVTDQSGGVLPGVVVSLKHVGTGRVFEGIDRSRRRIPGPAAADWHL